MNPKLVICLPLIFTAYAGSAYGRVVQVTAV